MPKLLRPFPRLAPRSMPRPMLWLKFTLCRGPVVLGSPELRRAEVRLAELRLALWNPELRLIERVVLTELNPGGRLAASSSLDSSSSESVCS